MVADGIQQQQAAASAQAQQQQANQARVAQVSQAGAASGYPYQYQVDDQGNATLTLDANGNRIPVTAPDGSTPAYSTGTDQSVTLNGDEPVSWKTTSVVDGLNGNGQIAYDQTSGPTVNFYGSDLADDSFSSATLNGKWTYIPDTQTVVHELDGLTLPQPLPVRA